MILRCPTRPLELDGVGLIEQGTVVLRDLDWTAGPRERWVVLRPNGSGKMLVLRAGTVVAAGPIATTLTSAAVSTAFGLDVTVATDGERWSARLSHP